METKMVPAKVVRISAEIAQQAADFAIANSTGTVALLLVNDICVGIDTSVIIPQKRQPVLRIIDETPIRQKTSFSNASVYEIIKTDGPITTTQLASRFGIVGNRNKLYQAVHGLKKEGYLDRNEVTGCYTITDLIYKTNGRKNRATLAKIRAKEMPITQDNILQVLHDSKDPMQTFDICNALRLKSKSKQRPKVTRLLRNEMLSENLIYVNQHGGGKSTYELTDLGREKTDDIKVVSPILKKESD